MILWHKLTPRGTRNTIKKYSTHASRASFQAQASLCVCVCVLSWQRMRMWMQMCKSMAYRKARIFTAQLCFIHRVAFTVAILCAAVVPPAAIAPSLSRSLMQLILFSHSRCSSASCCPLTQPL